MHIHLWNVGAEKLNQYYNRLDSHIIQSGEKQWVKYLDLGTHIVRLINYSKEFTSHVEKQLTYVLKDKSSSYDATLIIWKEAEVKSLAAKLEDDYNPAINFKFRIENLIHKRENFVDLHVFDDSYLKHTPLIDICSEGGMVHAHNPKTNTYYYGIENLEPEEFIKQGHIFVQTLNKILKTETSSLLHGAVVGLNNTGVLFCARGQRGKSTLAVLSMLKGFEYVSDDYLTISKEGEGLYAYPIYSIITLSPQMYNELYYELDGKFVSNNARKDKYVINIANYHDKFRKRYPINVCMFPQITNDKNPSIVPCAKGRAIAQLIHSTIFQMQDRHDIKTIKKLIDFVKDFDYYQINLCSDIWANVQCLREFMEDLEKKEKKSDQLCIK